MTEQQKTILKNIGVNLKETMERFSDNEDLYFNCLEKFKTSGYMDAFNSAFNEAQHDAAFEAIHALKGLAGNLGFTWLYKASSAVTEVLRTGSMEVEPDLIMELDDEYERVIANVNKL